MAKEKAVSGTISNVRIADVLDTWRKKPKELAFADTDVIIVTVKTAGGKDVKETFFTCLKPNGTFAIKTANRASQARREKLAKFLTHYKITNEPEEYNIVENASKWKGKKVKIVKGGEESFIFIP